MFKGVIEPLCTPAPPTAAQVFEKTFDREFAARQPGVEGDVEEWESVARALEGVYRSISPGVIAARDAEKRALDEENERQIRRVVPHWRPPPPR